MIEFPPSFVVSDRPALQAVCEAKRKYLAAHVAHLYANTNPAELWNNIVKYREPRSGNGSGGNGSAYGGSGSACGGNGSGNGNGSACDDTAGDTVEAYDDLRLSYGGFRSVAYSLLFHITPEEDRAAPIALREERKRLYFSHPFLSPSTFLAFTRAEDGTIAAVPMYAFAAKRLLLYRLRIELELVARVPPPALQDPSARAAMTLLTTTTGTGTTGTRSSTSSTTTTQLLCPPSASSPLSNGLTQEDVESFIFELLPNLRLVRDMPPWMHPYYLCHASRKFMFMCDTRRTGAISIESMMRSEVFSELLRMFESDANDAITTFPEGCTVDVAAALVTNDMAEDDTVPALVLSFDNEGNDPEDMYTVKTLNEDVVLHLKRSELYWNSGSTEFLAPEVLSIDNWFSLALMGRIYEHFTSLDLDGDGVLTVDEMARYSDSGFTRLAIERVFECHVPQSGQRHIMDYKTYLDFVIATEHAATLPAMKYIWTILDLEETKSFVTIDTLRCFCKEIASELIANGLMADISAQSILSEVIDMINPSWHESVRLDDIVHSGHQATVLPILLSYRNFYAYDCREQTAAAAKDEYA